MSKKLFFFTRHYPFHEIGESFIEREILFTSKEFDEIIIYPSNKHSFIREVPANVRVDETIINSKTNGAFHILTMYFMHIGLWSPVFISEIKERGFLHFGKNFLKYVRLMNIQLVRYDVLKSIALRNGGKLNICYDYWFINSTLALCFLKKRGFLEKLVVRSHKMDVFDEVQIDTGVPFRDYQFKWIDKMFTISHFNKNYFISKMEKKWESKIEVSYLGVKNGKLDNQNTIQEQGKKLVVSCAHMHDHKNIHLIPEVLKKMNIPIKWVHFGEGKNFKLVQRMIPTVPDNVEIDLKGVVSNTDVNEFYRTHKVDAFISLSNSEGIPVSIMEALANAIPIFAYAVDGVPEIAKDGITGMTIHQVADLDLVAKQLYQMLNMDFDMLQLKNYFHENFNEDKNYDYFAKAITAF
jgi:colanic acid/amylovoran biosynthesis glycosyltransferase